MNVQLLFQRKGKCVWSAQLHRAETTLGRALGCPIRIPSSEVSRLHCRIRIENDLVTVEDLESVNGTFLNGKRVRGVEIVRPGDRLALGSITFMVEYKLTPRALRQLGGGEECAVLEADSAFEPISEEPPELELELLEDAEEVEADVFVLDEAEEMHLPNSGGELRDFLIELDEDTDDHSKGR
jgi:pSer/pThr/pTyr-binding forkhead associated (FHA) protein